VIVSEETGHIGLALNGHIDRNLTPDQLRDRLRPLVLKRGGASRSAGSGAGYDV
jgi:hypothetical protein